jgi:hypothetical protein
MPINRILNGGNDAHLAFDGKPHPAPPIADCRLEGPKTGQDTIPVVFNRTRASRAQLGVVIIKEFAV